MRYALRELAKEDLSEIWRYTLPTWGLEQADDYVLEITDCFARLAEEPQIGTERVELENSLCSFPIGRHLIFYQKNHNRIDIVRVLHQQMDVNKWLVSSVK